MGGHGGIQVDSAGEESESSTSDPQTEGSDSDTLARSERSRPQSPPISDTLPPAKPHLLIPLLMGLCGLFFFFFLFKPPWLLSFRQGFM